MKHWTRSWWGTQVCMLAGDIKHHLGRPRFGGLFDRVHIGLMAAGLVKDDVIGQALADRAVVTMDTGR